MTIKDSLTSYRKVLHSVWTCPPAKTVKVQGRDRFQLQGQNRKANWRDQGKYKQKYEPPSLTVFNPQGKNQMFQKIKYQRQSKQANSHLRAVKLAGLKNSAWNIPIWQTAERDKIENKAQNLIKSQIHSG